jgi:hypothetical protein
VPPEISEGIERAKLNGVDLSEMVADWKKLTTKEEQLEQRVEMRRLLGDAAADRLLEAKRGAKKEEEKKKKDDNLQAVLLVLAEECELYVDQRATPFARIPRERHHEMWGVRSRRFRDWLAFRCFEKVGTAPGASIISDVINVIAGKALYASPELVLSNRFAWDDHEALWYDLSDAAWRAVRITPKGWRIVNDPPPLFRRYGHQRPQVGPLRGGTLDPLLDLLNLASDEDQWLFKVWMVAALIPDVPRPVLILWGPQGSAKTATARLIKALLDPSAFRDGLSFPTRPRELTQVLDHHAVAAFDNVGYLKQDISDHLCRAVTGGGFSKRQLYTDEADIIFEFRRIVVLNGISIPGTRPDLLDRSILLNLGHIDKTDRRLEKELTAEFEAHRPRILGAMFSLLSRAMQTYDSTVLDGAPRMADWTRWGMAIAEAIEPGGAELLLEAYRQNRLQQNEEALAAHAIGAAVLALMADVDRNEWTGTPSKLLTKLNQVAEENSIDTTSRLWPRGASWLLRRLQEVETNLVTTGIKVTATRTAGQRLITLTRAAVPG